MPREIDNVSPTDYASLMPSMPWSYEEKTRVFEALVYTATQLGMCPHCVKEHFTRYLEDHR